jgi:hypothetical protein
MCHQTSTFTIDEHECDLQSYSREQKTDEVHSVNVAVTNSAVLHLYIIPWNKSNQINKTPQERHPNFHELPISHDHCLDMLDEWNECAVSFDLLTALYAVETIDVQSSP